MMPPAVSGTTQRSFQMNEQRPLMVRTFAVATYVMGRGYPVRAVHPAQDGFVGEVIFRFDPEAASAVAEYGQHKQELRKLMAEMRR